MKQRKKYWLNEWKKMRKEKNEDKLKESGVDMLLVTI
jgi:endo-alpha-1,4-polygalactosaminidase (GH114 family)